MHHSGMTAVSSPAPVAAKPVAAPSSAALRDAFLLDQELTYLSHASYGACPRPVFEAYQHLQMEIEQQPVDFYDRRLTDRLVASQRRLAEFMSADPAGLRFFPDVDRVVTVLARAFDLRSGDEILTTNHDNGDVVSAWKAVCDHRGMRLTTVTLPDPLHDPNDVVSSLEAARTPQTRLVTVSHITSATATVLPIQRIAQWAAEAGLICVVDGSQALGQVPLDLSRFDVAVYFTNPAIWLCAPRGSLAVWIADPFRVDAFSAANLTAGSYGLAHQCFGSPDFAAVLSVSAAIAFQKRCYPEVIRARSHLLAQRFRSRVMERYGTVQLHTDPQWFAQTVSVPIPWAAGRGRDLQDELREKYRIEVPVDTWSGRVCLRPSFQGYNDLGDVDQLMNALDALL